LLHQCFQLQGVGGESANALGQLFRGHGIFVQRKAKRGLVVQNAFLRLGPGLVRVQGAVKGMASSCCRSWASSSGAMVSRSQPARARI
jgi:hypothetical protein